MKLEEQFPVGSIVELIDNRALADILLGTTGVVVSINEYTKYPILVNFTTEQNVPVDPTEIKVIYVSGF